MLRFSKRKDRGIWRKLAESGSAQLISYPFMRRKVPRPPGLASSHVSVTIRLSASPPPLLIVGHHNTGIAMAGMAHLATTSPSPSPLLPLPPRTTQPWTPSSGLECLPSSVVRAGVSVSSSGNRKTGIIFPARNLLVPGDARSCTKKWGKVRRSANHQWQCSVQENPRTLQTSSMDETYDALARHLLSAALITEPGQKYMVGIAGSPGAGKSTVAKEVAVRLNALWFKNQGEKNGEASEEIAVAVPMDGFHLYRWQLDAMQDPLEAHARRGAHWTFDPASLVKNLQHLRSQGWAHLPSFDHGVGDPVEKDIYVSPIHKVVLVEGNYLLMEEGEWTGLADLFDERWYVDIDIDVAMNRVERRHVSTGKAPDYAKQRVVYNDRPNAELIALTKWNADLIIPSISAY